GDDPVVRAGDREVHVEPVRPRLPRAHADAAAAAAAATAATAATAASCLAGRGRHVVVAVAPDRDAEVVPVAVWPGGHGAAAGREGGVPAVLQALAAVELDGDDPVVGAGDREVHVEPVRPRLPRAHTDAAAAVAAAATAASATAGAVVQRAQHGVVRGLLVAVAVEQQWRATTAPRVAVPDAPHGDAGAA